MKCRATAAAWFSTFLLNAFVSRVNRRICIRIVKFCRSTYDVEISFGFGLPFITSVVLLRIFAGLYRVSFSTLRCKVTPPKIDHYPDTVLLDGLA